MKQKFIDLIKEPDVEQSISFWGMITFNVGDETTRPEFYNTLEDNGWVKSKHANTTFTKKIDIQVTDDKGALQKAERAFRKELESLVSEKESKIIGGLLSVSRIEPSVIFE